MRYTKLSIDRVREQDIVKTIEDFITLKRSGSGYEACSPFTEEKSASFKVNPSDQFFKCFSSGIGGDAIKFVQLHKNVEFIEAVEIIAKIHNISLEKEEVTPELQRKLDTKSEMYSLSEKVNRSFVNAYKKLDATHWAKQLIADRKFDTDSLIDFQVGYNDDSNKLTDWVLNNGLVNTAKEVGLVKTNNNISQDFFRNRIMFPIHNEKGAIVGFGGRQSNDPNLKKQYKYINSKKSLIYDKSGILYGLFQAKTTINKVGSVILTEGYTDVIAMHQNGCKNTVGSCGTALTERHAQILKKYADEVILLRDGDAAGLRTMLKKDGDIDICLSYGLKVSICLLPDGEDPDSFSRTQLDMHTWIHDNKQDAILYKVSQYDLVRDRYQKEVEEMKSSYQLLISDAISNKIDEKDLEADDLKAAKKNNKEVAKNVAILKKEEVKELAGIPKIDTYKKSFAVTDIANTLFKIKHEVNRADYVKQIAKILKIATTALKAEIGKFEVAAAEEEQKKKEKDGTLYSTRNIKLPKGGNMQEYLEHGFITIGNQYHFPIGGNFTEGTDWKFEPLFQIMGDKENKRLAEITNTAHQKKIIEFDSEILSSFGEFRRFLFKLNGFLFYTDNGIRTEHFDRFVRRYNREFQPAHELLTMGQNPKGFYAFANGVYWQGKFRPVNKFGIMNLKGIDTSDGEYNEKIDNYYSPAFSVMHKDNQVGDDKYENDRYFVYKESPITLNDWMDKMKLVFEEKGIFGILFNFGALFRDLFITHYSSYPLLGGFGETGSGKSAFGEILQNFFYYRMAGVDLTQATSSGLSKTLTRTTNTVVFLDEFQDKTIKPDLANLTMGGWNGNGRVKSKDVGSTRTTVEKIMTAIYYCGQFLPTYMDGGLANRTMSLYFQKKEKRSSIEKERFTDLLNVTNEGISSLTSEIIQYRDYFSKNLPRTFAETERTLKALMKEEQYDDRVFKNTTMILTTYMILKEKIDFPFTEDEISKLCVNLIIENSEQIRDTSALTEFWNILTFLFENNKIKDHLHFRIDKNTSFRVEGEKRTQFVHKNENNNQILYLRLTAVYQLYNKEATTREGVDVIGISTIRNYLHSCKEFIGLIKGKRFGKAGSPSCYALDYTVLKQKGLVNLIEDTTPYTKGPGELKNQEPTLTKPPAEKPKSEEPDDLPF